MISKASVTAKIISQAESYDGIQAGIVRLEDVLKGPSYQVNPEGPEATTESDDDQIVDWPVEAKTVLILGLNHPEEDPRLDY